MTGATCILQGAPRAKRNLRVWLNDGSEDQETNPGDGRCRTPDGNSIKMRGYDFHFSFAVDSTPRRVGVSDFRSASPGLWRDYDPAKTEQTFEQSEEERPSRFSRTHFTIASPSHSRKYLSRNVSRKLQTRLLNQRKSVRHIPSGWYDGCDERGIVPASSKFSVLLNFAAASLPLGPTPGARTFI